MAKPKKDVPRIRVGEGGLDKFLKGLGGEGVKAGLNRHMGGLISGRTALNPVVDLVKSLAAGWTVDHLMKAVEEGKHVVVTVDGKVVFEMNNPNSSLETLFKKADKPAGK